MFLLLPDNKGYIVSDQLEIFKHEHWRIEKHQLVNDVVARACGLAGLWWLLLSKYYIEKTYGDRGDEDGDE